jgi:hypothetical protein
MTDATKYRITVTTVLEGQTFIDTYDRLGTNEMTRLVKVTAPNAYSVIITKA